MKTLRIESKWGDVGTITIHAKLEDVITALGKLGYMVTPPKAVKRRIKQLI